MIFAILTLVAALALAAVAGWFSIIGIMSIYAGASFQALIMGVVLEAGKLVTTSWLYRNWNYSTWHLKAPLIIFTLILMIATSIGVFGFLSKAHLEQGASTLDNSAKIERLEQQILREKNIIASNQIIIDQLDATVNSYLNDNKADRSIAVRRMQNAQRKELSKEINLSQQRIDQYNDEKLKLQSEIRKLQLDVGPIRYIADLIYGTAGNTDKNIEAAVRIFTLIIVSTLDPLAVILLIAANHTLIRLRSKNEESGKEKHILLNNADNEATPVDNGLTDNNILDMSTENEIIAKDTTDTVTNVSESDSLLKNNVDLDTDALSRYVIPTEEKAHSVKNNTDAWVHKENIFREIVGNSAHFVPQKVKEHSPTLGSNNAEPNSVIKDNSYPKPLSWLTEFRRPQ